MKVGLIGFGGWGRNLAQTLYELGALGGVAELHPEGRAKVSALYPDVPVYPGHQALLETDLPAVAIATPAATHYAVAKEALLAGKHVFVEKPLAMTTAEAEELVTLAQKVERILMVGHILLYQPAIRWIKEFIDSESIGKIWSLHQERLNLGKVRAVENVLFSLAVHDVAVLVYLLGQAPKRIVAQGQAILQPTVEDDVYLHMQFPGEVYAHIHASWLWPKKRRRLTILGSKGILVYDEMEQTVMLHHKGVNPDLSTWDKGVEVIFRGHGEPLKLELAHFLQCISEGKTPLSDGVSALPVVRVLEEATRQLSRLR